MDSKFVKEARPYVAATILQFGFAGLAIIAKFALNQGMNHYTFSVYRNVIAAAAVAPFAFFLERKIRPKMTFSVLYKIIILAILEPVIDQNLYYMGMQYTTATFTTAMCNILPAITFVLAWAVRLEKMDLRKIHSQAKIVGTIVTVSGAMIMTLVQGPPLALPWTQPNSQLAQEEKAHQDPVKGALMITAACVCWSIFYIIQAITLKAYPAGLSLTALICMFGALQGTVLTLVVEKSNTSIWSIGWNLKLLAWTYAGVISSGITYYVSGIVMKEKGPVFVTSFNPLAMIFVAVMSSFVFAEQLNVGKVAGSMVIVVGLYLVIWGKTRDEVEPIYSDSEMTDQQTTVSSNEDYPYISKNIDNVV